MAQPSNIGHDYADNELILARAIVGDNVAEYHLAVEAAGHDAFDDLARFAGLLHGGVALAVAGELELGPDLYTTGRDVEVVQADLRDPRG